MLLALLIALIALLGAGVLVGGGLYLAARRARALQSQSAPALPSGGGAALLERTIKDIRTGDVLQYDRKDYLVEGVISYNEDGHTWNAARLLDGSDERWLVIGHERGGAMTLRMMQLDPAIEVSGYPPEQLAVGETRFSQDKRGTATATANGETGSLPIGEGAGAESVLRCRWWRYETAGDQSLIVEQWGALYRVLRGKKLGNDEVELIPGS